MKKPLRRLREGLEATRRAAQTAPGAVELAASHRAVRIGLAARIME
jgi:hypothetical protein